MRITAGGVVLTDQALVNGFMLSGGLDTPPQPKFWLGMERADEEGWAIISEMEWDPQANAWFYVLTFKGGRDDMVHEDSMEGTWKRR